MARPNKTVRYALTIVLVSLVFIPFTIALLAALSFGHTITWQHVLIVIGVFAAFDIALITVTGRERRSTRYADSSQSTH
jgi:Kef-type K+ transport system membrane component KefB